MTNQTRMTKSRRPSAKSRTIVNKRMARSIRISSFLRPSSFVLRHSQPYPASASQEATRPEFLHRIPLVMVLGPARALAHLRRFKLGNDFVDIRRLAFDRMRDRSAA